MHFESYLFGCATEGKVVAIYSDVWHVELRVQTYDGIKLDGYETHIVRHANFNKWVANALGDNITKESIVQLLTVIEALKK
jgi:hypothetical protein